MTHADLLRSVEAVLASKRLGTPVFVRYLVHSPGNRAAALDRLTRAVMEVRAWLAQPLERLYAIGRLQEGHATLLLEFRRGATASVSLAGTPGPGGSRHAVDLTIVGNHGALCHDFGSSNLWESGDAAEEPAPDKKLAELIERAMKSGQPETIQE